MSMADVLAVISGLIIVGLAFPSLLLLITINFPQLVERTAQQTETKPIRNIFTGAAISIGLLFTLGVFAKAPGPIKLTALSILLTGFSIAMLGAAGLVSLLAKRYENFFNAPKSLSSLAFSAIFLELAFVLPIVGWFVVLPISFFLMLGASSKALIQTTIAQLSFTKPTKPSQPTTVAEANHLHPVS